LGTAAGALSPQSLAISRKAHAMRLLAFSDIHHNLVAVRKMRALENNSFDAIIVAGDIGNESAADFFGILATFKCPVMYVYGNWDNKLGYKTSST
jgi:predicted phosphodiesterase